MMKDSKFTKAQKVWMKCRIHCSRLDRCVNGSDNHIGEFDTPYIKLSTLPPITKSENPEYYVKAEMVLKGKEYCHLKVVDYFGGSVLITVPASHVQNMNLGQSPQTQS